MHAGAGGEGRAVSALASAAEAVAAATSCFDDAGFTHLGRPPPVLCLQLLNNLVLLLTAPSPNANLGPRPVSNITDVVTYHRIAKHLTVTERVSVFTAFHAGILDRTDATTSLACRDPLCKTLGARFLAGTCFQLTRRLLLASTSI